MKRTLLVLLSIASTVASADPPPPAATPPADASTPPQPIALDGSGSGATAPPATPGPARPAPAPAVTGESPPATPRLPPAAPVPAPVTPPPSPAPTPAGYRDGFFFIRSPDGGSQLRIGGYTQFDGRFFVDESGAPPGQFVFRRIRPELRGTVFQHYDFRLLTDFAGGKLVVEDAYVDVHYSDLLELRAGKFKVPFGLEILQSTPAVTFIERGLPSLLAPNRDLGVELFGDLGRGIFAYQVGLFDGVPNGQSGDGDTDDHKDLAARVFVRPLAHGAALVRQLGVGAAVTYGYEDGTLAAPELAGYKTQGQTTFFQYKTGTSLANETVAAGQRWRATAQGYWYAGPVGVLAEYVRSSQDVALGSKRARVVTDAWQALAQWVVTGDPASYGGVVPRHPFDPRRGTWGAFDVAARYGELGLVDSRAFDAGVADPTKAARRVSSAGAGVDWYANASFRVVLDLEHSWFEGGAKTGDRPPETSFIGRLQLVF